MKLIQKHKSLLIFTFLNYVDKAISFALPLFVLYLLKDISLYNDIEYIFSYANILVVIADLGMRMFFLYNYPKQVHDEKNYLSSVKSYFYIISFVYVLIGLGLVLISKNTGLITVLVPFICIRTLMMLFTNFFGIYYRLKDSPQIILYYSIIINLITFIVMIVFVKWLKIPNSLMLFFSIQMVFVLWFAIKGVKYIKKKVLEEMFKFVSNSLIYAWPLILNVLILTFINNYGKIYAFNHLSKSSMFSFSYTMRIAMIIQMAHSSVVAYYSKDIFLNTANKINYKMYKLYNLFIIVAVFISLLFLIMINSFNIVPMIDIDTTVIVLILYVFLWCQVAYFEQYLSKHNKNMRILIFAVSSSIVYILMLMLYKAPSVSYIALSMLISIIVNLGAIMFSVYKLKLL